MKNFYSLRFIAFLFIAFLSSNSFAQSFNWIKSGYRTDCNNGVYPRDVTADVNDNVISVGYYYATTANAVAFDGNQLLGYTSNTFESNVFVVKYNNAGTIQWLKRIGTDRDDDTHPRVESDNSGNIIVAAGLSGITNGSIGYIDGTTMTQPVLPNDAVVAKFSSSGTLSWYKHFTGSGNITIYDLKTDSKGDIYITGSFNGSLSFDNNNFTGSAGLNANFFIAKLSASGNLLWWKNATGNGSDAGYRLHVNDTSVFVLGVFAETNSDTDMTFESVTYTIPNANYDATFIAKFNSLGNLNWLKYGYLQDSGGGSGTMPYYCDITSDSTGNVYSIFSVSQSGAGINFVLVGPSSYTYLCTGTGGSDYILLKHSPSGTPLVISGDGGNSSGNNIFPTSMIMHSKNELFVTYMIGGTVDIANNPFTSVGSEDMVIARFDMNCDLNCAKQYGGTNQDWPMAIEETSTGNIAYTGHVFGGVSSAVITSYDGKSITGCRNTGVTGMLTLPLLSYNAPLCKNNGGIEQPIITGVSTPSTYSFFSTPSGLSINSNGNINVGNSLAGTYTVSVMILPPIGCDSSLSTTVTIDSIDVSVTQNANVLTANQTGASYQWIECVNNQPLSGETNQAYTASSPGSYAVIITTNNCSDTSACYNITSVGINNQPQNNLITLSPNPAKNTITLSFSENIINSTITLYNVFGQLLYQKNNFSGNKESIDISILSTGMYFVEINTGTQTTKIKFIKE